MDTKRELANLKIILRLFTPKIELWDKEIYLKERDIN